ncbi:MAG: 3-dehydroquinate synthase [Flavobacteriaceae bacterium CG_4_8_14_3_um_filter_34_10]|nr:3-dehydroquinate synthase [Flavobacteriia bacterium]OIP49313.1 MAG: 3-dehydroquinate synthase [Flavobacteriaceae bacterium CG2_30_34_30]PIQ17483.1 MAG: 3-dehydroquinate synthase [Flavobacteriaceae bacterium CG18_big_fil_WC_8_21_14_2_50_34_36]PIV50267.1 MAG: 3-dehydroquinate synthase [Flavobacteriaceae bacterium CG02_land_8_20_14_3_00_34_13]PIX10071.1 MAG: 3-dehydroquinate synthase [Flavobacteriaceae bacterium CG_4_8_14_3_um_filter_34_10]PIZ06844.1 MAG: 3-dehydroquinate synthase [Flavobacter
MKSIPIKEYSVFFNAEIYQHINTYISDKSPSKIVILTDNNTEKQCLPIFLSKLECTCSILHYSIPAGETNKNIPTCIKLWQYLSENRIERSAVFLNLGGGVVTDLGGFVASTFLRGVPFIHIPTTLLSMVDASIGGKTGVDLGVLKNQIGVIQTPKMVLIDPLFLLTLPERELHAGIAEMLKHGLIHSKTYWLKLTSKKIIPKSNLDALIWESVKIKNEIVEQDPYEKGLRKILNFGHTLGHAIESYFLSSTKKEPLLHGEAIAIGMLLSGYLSREILGFPDNDLKKMISVYKNYFQKVSIDNKDIASIIEYLQFDKKNRNNRTPFVLLLEIGVPKMNCMVSNDLIYEAFGFYQDSFKRNSS